LEGILNKQQSANWVISLFLRSMKKEVAPLIAIVALYLCSCHNPPDSNKGQAASKLQKPAVISDSMPVTNDSLNHFKFSIQVIPDSNAGRGVYDVDADFGPNFAEGQFSMPKGAEDLTPIIRKGIAPNTFIIGFKVPDDTTFYEYFEVSSSKAATKMLYIKTYTF
jgi:hypothetical protein